MEGYTPECIEGPKHPEQTQLWREELIRTILLDQEGCCGYPWSSPLELRISEVRG